MTDQRKRICDVSDPVAVAALVRATEEAFGGVQVLVNNAALFGKDRSEDVRRDRLG